MNPRMAQVFAQNLKKGFRRWHRSICNLSFLVDHCPYRISELFCGYTSAVGNVAFKDSLLLTHICIHQGEAETLQMRRFMHCRWPVRSVRVLSYQLEAYFFVTVDIWLSHRDDCERIHFYEFGKIIVSIFHNSIQRCEYLDAIVAADATKEKLTVLRGHRR